MSAAYQNTPTMRMDKNAYNAALAFYKLPADYERVFSLYGPEDLRPATIVTAAQLNQPSWVQVNEPVERTGLRKAYNKDIAVFRNLTLDFEYAQNPKIAHAIGIEFMAWLVGEGYAADETPLEDSGAGCHICLPVADIAVEDGETFNAAVGRFVRRMFVPVFDTIAAEKGLAPVTVIDTEGKSKTVKPIKLEAFDISRIFSLPGTWRPGGTKQNEADYLRNGYVRRWLPPYVKGHFPTRKESRVLRLALIEELRTTPTPVATTPSSPTAFGEMVEARLWVEDYANRHQNEDRSTWFHSVVCAAWKKYGDDTLITDLAGDIDTTTGGKYKERAATECKRSLNAAHELGRDDTKERHLTVIFGGQSTPGTETTETTDEKPTTPTTRNPTTPSSQIMGYGFSPAHFMHAYDLDKLPPVEWLIANELPKKALAVMYGPSGSGKSTIALSNYALPLAQDGVVIYIAAEGASGYHQRVRAWMREKKSAAGSLYFYARSLNLMSFAETYTFIEYCRSLKPRLIVVDTLAWCMAAFGGDENTTKDMMQFVINCDFMRQELEASILIVHHSGKTGTSERGSSALKAAADTMIEVTAEEDILKVDCIKQKDAMVFEPQYFKRIISGESFAVVPAHPNDKMSSNGKPSKRLLDIMEKLSFGVFTECGAKSAQLAQMLDVATKGQMSSLYENLSILKKQGYINQSAKGDPYFISDSGREVLRAYRPMADNTGN